MYHIDKNTFIVTSCGALEEKLYTHVIHKYGVNNHAAVAPRDHFPLNKRH